LEEPFILIRGSFILTLRQPNFLAYKATTGRIQSEIIAVLEIFVLKRNETARRAMLTDSTISIPKVRRKVGLVQFRKVTRMFQHLPALITSDDQAKLSFLVVEFFCNRLTASLFIACREPGVPANKDMMWENWKQNSNDMTTGNSKSRVIETRAANLEVGSLFIH
jgi:hypothetical protein